MKRKNLIIIVAALAVFVGTSATLWAGLTPEEVARLGADLTPMGAEKAGNADGTIPAWDGGITTPPEGYKVGDHYIKGWDKKDEERLNNQEELQLQEKQSAEDYLNDMDGLIDD